MSLPQVGHPEQRAAAAVATQAIDVIGADGFDIVVAGGGITGACVALEAASRGMRTLLVDRGDFGGGASANCLKIVHGGLRYVQHLDFRRMREAIGERSMWLRSAPHLVEPLPVLMPTWRGAFPPRAALAAALALNEAVSADRNRDLLPDRRIPSARVLGRTRCSELAPMLDAPGLTGGVLFHDALMYSPERLTLEVVLAAQAAGATVANYVELTAATARQGRMHCVHLRDVVSGSEAEVPTRWLVNATGASTLDITKKLVPRDTVPAQGYSLALNLVTRLPAPPLALAVAGGSPDPDRLGRSGSRQLFLVPWRGQMMAGTAHQRVQGDPSLFSLRDEHVDAFINEVRSARPAVGLTRHDVVLIHWGLLPDAPSSGSATGAVRLLKRHRILDHGEHGLAGAFSVVSIKYTTARALASQVLDRVAPARGAHRHEHRLALPGGGMESLDALRTDLLAHHGAQLPGDILEHLLRSYGARAHRVLELSRTVPDWDRRVVPGAPVILAQLVFGVREELARTPDDLLWRRTEIGPRGLLSAEARRLAQAAFD